jgi:hypothetical protein
MLTLFGVAALTFMMLMYALERRHRGFILAFTLGCILASAYGFLAGAWPFGVVEAIWGCGGYPPLHPFRQDLQAFDLLRSALQAFWTRGMTPSSGRSSDP